MRPTVHFRLPDGSTPQLAELGPGDLIGRSPSAALCIDDPRISEAHAFVSLRGTQLKLLALRGRFAVYGKTTVETVLRPQLRIMLAGVLPLVVESVQLPTEVLTIETDGLPRQVLASVTSIRVTPDVVLAVGFDAAAAAVIWHSGDVHRLRIPGQADRLLAPGDTFEIDGRRFAAVAAPLGHAALSVTPGTVSVSGGLTLRLRSDTVHILAESGARVVIDGIPARIVGRLAAAGLPIPWDELAVAVWPHEDDVVLRRQKWDASLQRLRGKLRAGKVRTDLVRSDNSGRVELYVGANDQIIDET